MTEAKMRRLYIFRESGLVFTLVGWAAFQWRGLRGPRNSEACPILSISKRPKLDVPVFAPNFPGKEPATPGWVFLRVTFKAPAKKVSKSFMKHSNNDGNRPMLGLDGQARRRTSGASVDNLNTKIPCACICSDSTGLRR